MGPASRLARVGWLGLDGSGTVEFAVSRAAPPVGLKDGWMPKSLFGLRVLKEACASPLPLPRGAPAATSWMKHNDGMTFTSANIPGGILPDTRVQTPMDYRCVAAVVCRGLGCLVRVQTHSASGRCATSVARAHYQPDGSCTGVAGSVPGMETLWLRMQKVGSGFIAWGGT